MTTDIQKLDPDAAIDLAYDIFLEMAGENLDPADIMLFNLQFEDRGAVEFVETADDWEQEIVVLVLEVKFIRDRSLYDIRTVKKYFIRYTIASLPFIAIKLAVDYVIPFEFNMSKAFLFVTNTIAPIVAKIADNTQ